MSLSVDITKNLGDFCLDVSFESQGVTGVLGASGSGKSMTLMCIAGIVKPSRGRIVLNGTVLFDSEDGIDMSPQQRRIGYLFQNYALFPTMTVRQNILCGLRHDRGPASKAQIREERFREIIEIMQLQGLEDRRPSQLSGGQQQRVALARILIGDPEMLILDEPFSALDTQLRGQLQMEAQKILRRFGKDALVVTHDRDEAYQLCAKIALLDGGNLMVYKETKELFAEPECRAGAYLTGCKNVVDAVKTGAHEVSVPEWGVRLTTSQPVGDDVCAIGIRAHYFNPNAAQNRFPIHFMDEIEGPFEYTIQFRYGNQRGEAQDIWWLVPKEKRPARFPEELGVAPANIMLLYR